MPVCVVVCAVWSVRPLSLCVCCLLFVLGCPMVSPQLVSLFVCSVLCSCVCVSLCRCLSCVSLPKVRATPCFACVLPHMFVVGVVASGLGRCSVAWSAGGPHHRWHPQSQVWQRERQLLGIGFNGLSGISDLGGNLRSFAFLPDDQITENSWVESGRLQEVLDMIG